MARWRRFAANNCGTVRAARCVAGFRAPARCRSALEAEFPGDSGKIALRQRRLRRSLFHDVCAQQDDLWSTGPAGRGGLWARRAALASSGRGVTVSRSLSLGLESSERADSGRDAAFRELTLGDA